MNISNLHQRVRCSLTIVGLVFPLITSAQAPRITQQPLSQSALAGTTISFSVAATGKTPLAYYWSLNGTTLVDSVRISGAQSSMLTILGIMATDAGAYQVIVSNRQGTDVSAPATLTVFQPPAITQSPQSRTNVVGSTATFSVTATGTAPLRYQWRLNGSPLSAATGSSLTLPGVQLADAGSYTAVVTNLYGRATSGAAVLTVRTPPVIVGEPLSQTAYLLGTASFGLAVESASPFGCQWYLNGTPLADGGRIGGARATSLTIANLQGSDSGSYYLVVTNLGGSATSAVGVLSVVPVIGWGNGSPDPLYFSDVTNAIAIDGGEYDALVLPADGAIAGYTDVVQVAAGGLHDVALRADGSVVAWGYDGSGQAEVPPGLPEAVAVAAGRHCSLALLADSTVVGWGAVGSPPWALSNVVEIASDSGSLFDAALLVDGTVVEWDIFGERIVDAATNMVAISFASQLMIGLEAGGTVRTWCSGCSPSPLAGPTNIVAVGAGFYQVLAATADGQAVVWGGNDSGQANVPAGLGGVIAVSGGLSYSMALVGTGPPQITKWLPRRLTGVAGRPVFLRMPASGLRPLTYRWYRDGTLVAQGTNDVLAFGQVQASDAGNYSVSVSNAFGCVTGRVTTLSVTIPPLITQQPQSLTVVRSNTAAFTVAASGPGPLGYQWCLNGMPLSDTGRVTGSTGTNLVIANAQPSDAGYYTVVVTNSAFVVTSATATLTVLVPPSISIQPQNQSALLGSNVVFTAIAAGTSPLRYQWYFEGLALTNNARVSGVTSNSLRLSSVQTSDAGDYWLVVTNLAGGATSRLARLTVLVPPAIVAQPQSQSVLAGYPVLFTVQAAGTAPLSYQWFRNGAFLAGATTPNLTLPSVQLADTGSYTVAVTNSVGVASSAPAILTVLAAPVITQQPQDRIGAAGSNTTFYVAATGTVPLSYRWLFNGAPLADGGRISGAASNILAVANLQPTDAGSYRVIVTNTVGAATSSMASLTVLQPPVIIAQPMSQSVMLSNSAAFSAQASGTPPLSWQWLRNGISLTGATDMSLLIPSAQLADAGSYTVLVSNLVGVAWSSPATLTVFSPPMITSPPASQSAALNGSAALAVTAAGTLPLYYQWFFNGAPLADGARISGAASNILSIANLQTNDAGQYSVVITNAYGTAASDPALLTVIVPPSLVVQPMAQTAVMGSNALLSVVAAGSEPLGYQWLFNGAPLTDGPRITGSGSPALTISNVQLVDAGSYTVTVTNVAGSTASTAAVLTVVQPPGIVMQPVGRSAVLGLPVSFSVSATGTAPLSYQWQLNGADVPGGTNITLTIPAAGTTNFGVYQVTVSNAVGVATSAPAALTRGSVAAWARNDSQQTMVPAGLTDVVAVAGGVNHSLALRTDGTVAVWGGNTYGQTNLPAGLTNVVAIAAGAYHSLALRSDGTVLAWGRTTSGQTSVPSTLSNVVAIAAGASHSAALRADGIVVGWGTFSTTKIGVPADLRKVTAIAANGGCILALRSDGTVVAWGDNVYGQTNVPPGLNNVVAIAAGGNHNLALRANGTVVAWGWNNYGQTNVPPALNNAVAIAAGSAHSLALRSDGTAVAWGYNNYSQTNTPAPLNGVLAIACGDSHNLAIVGDGSPLLVRQPVGGTFCTGRDLLLQAQAVGASWLFYQWRQDGVNIPGATNATLSLSNLTAASQGIYQVVAGSTASVVVSVPAPVVVRSNAAPFILSSLPITQTNYYGSRVVLGASVGGSGPLHYQWRFYGQPISGATNEELVLDPAVTSHSGQYSVMVNNQFGSVVISPDNLSVVQVKVWGYYPDDPPASASNAVAIATSSGQYMALRPDGKVVVWGHQGGYPAPPAWLSNVVAVAAGTFHFVALRADGTVASWGTTELGLTNPPAGLNSVVAIAAGYGFTLALRADGSVVAWGNNSYGQTTVPTSVTGVVSIAAGYYHGLALRSDGSVVGWGNNYYGQTGPPPRTGNTNFIAIAAGDYHNLALRADGTVVAWGQGNMGQTNVPSGLSNVVAIAAGRSHSLALRADGTVVAWGIYYQSPATIPSDFGPPVPANIVQIAGGGDHSMALFGARTPYVTVQPFNRTLLRGTNTAFVAKVVGPQPVRYQWQFNGVPIIGATTDTLSLTNLQWSQSGAYQLVATNAYGMGTSVSAKLMVTIPLAQALDTTNLTWASSGNASWYGQPETTFDGVAAARSGGIGNGQETILQTSVVGPGRVVFWWKVSSEQDFDMLEFKLAGLTQAMISGEAGWEQRSFLVPSGTQSLQWRYSKDPSFTDGQDAAWLDQVVFIPDPPVLAQQPASLTVNVGTTVYWYATATGTPPYTYQWLKNGNDLPGATASSLLLTNATRRTDGLYAVRVSNGGGGTLSTNAVLKVIVPQRLGAPSLLPNGTLVLTSGDADGGLLTAADLAGFEAQVSTNLVNWDPLPGALTLTNGLLQLQEPGAAGHPCRFYRIVEP